jgi:hypothetical protein
MGGGSWSVQVGCARGRLPHPLPRRAGTRSVGGVSARLTLGPVVLAAVLALALSAKVARAADPVVPAPPPQAVAFDPLRPPPLHVEYAQYGAAITSLLPMSTGALCGAAVKLPCILGGGGGLVIRGGYRSPGPWYVGGAYEFTKMDSGNLYRLGIFQDLRAEVRYLPDSGSRAAPYLLGGIGAAVYGNEWRVETGGALLMVGGGVEFEVSRLAHVGLSIFYRPVLLAGWTDTAKIARPTGLAQFFGLEIQLEVRTELNRR